MVTRKGSLSDYQSVGFGGLSFITDMNFLNVPMSYEQRLWALEGLYACAVAKIESDPKYKEDKDVGMLIGGTRIMLDQAGKDYDPLYENKTYGDRENTYRRLLCQIFENITEIQGKTKMIERQVMTMEEIG